MKKLFTPCFTLFFFCNTLCIPNAVKAQPQVNFSPLIQNLTAPLEIKNAGDGTGRLFIAEQGGLIKIYKNGSLLNKPFLDLSSIVGVGDLIGVWSIAFSPNYKNNRRFFVFYSDKKGATKLARFQTSIDNPDSAMPNSGVILISFAKSTGLGHYGNLVVGNDGYLYVSIGAGGNNKNSQDGQSLFGKIIRLDVNVSSAPYYSIPPDNPFVNDPSVRDEIWHLGLRNAWRWSFDKPNGDIWIADVGQDSMEEIDYRTPAQSPGSNFGWQCYEGTQNYKTKNCGNINQYVFPIFEYQHDISNGGECIIGGYVYRGSAYPALKGYYLCADFLKTNMWKIKSNGSGGWNVYLQKAGVPRGITTFGEGEDAELYAASSTLGIVYRVQATASVASLSTDAAADGIKSDKDLNSYVYPTLVENSKVMLVLKEAYSFVSVIDMSGHELLRKILDGKTGTITLDLPKLNTGMYIVQIVGTHKLVQKIYVTK